MAIGDELFSLLGLVPSRDRAGIARGTMADEAKASISANSGNAEGRALIDQGTRPPDFELPADIPTAYATGRGPIRAAPYGGSGVISSVIPPAPSERVVASGPAAAPPPAVVRNSDIILSAMQRQAQAQRMQQIIGSIGMIANAFNRNPDSQAATKASLAGMMGGGGGGGAGGGDIGTLQKLLEMRDAETNTERMVDQAKRMFGLSDQDARARMATGELTKLFAPDQIRQRAGDELAAKTRMELMKPEVVEALSKRLGQPKEVIEAGIRSGKIGPKELTDIEKDQATTTKTRVETRETEGKIALTEAERASYERAQKNPEAVMKLYDWSPSQYEKNTASPDAWKRAQEGSISGATQPQQNFTFDRARAREQGSEALAAFDKRYPDLPTYERSKVPGTIEEPGAKLVAEADKGFEKSYREDLYPKAEAAKQAIEGRGTIIADLFRNNIRSGGKLSQLGLDVRKTIATTLKMPINEADINTEVFFAAIKQNILQREGQMKGTLSNADMQFLAALNGSMEQTPETLRRLQHIEEKLHRGELDNYRERFERDQTNPNIPAHTKEVAKRYAPLEQPRPTKITDDIVKEKDKKTGKSGLDDIRDAKAAGLADDPDIQRVFNQKYGRGMFRYYLGEVR